MKRWLVLILPILIAASSAGATCLDSDKVELILGAKDRGESLASIKRGFFPGADAETLDTVTQVYKSNTKPWNAADYSMTLCGHTKTDGALVLPNPNCPNGSRTYPGGLYECIKPPQEEAEEQAQLEKRRQVDYQDSFNHLPNIPGICVGEACKNVRKIQHWDANGNMTN